VIVKASIAPVIILSNAVRNGRAEKLETGRNGKGREGRNGKGREARNMVKMERGKK